MTLEVVLRGGAKTKNGGSEFCVLKIILSSDIEWDKIDVICYQGERESDRRGVAF